MKILLSLIVMLMSLSAFAVEREKLEQLLIDKGTSIAAFEARGLQLIMGERTGGGMTAKFANVEVIFTKDEAILRNEIQHSNPLEVSSISRLESIQASGRHIIASEIVGVISK